MSDLNFSIKGVSENPVEYLLASYAGCLNVMGHLIAGELGFKLDKLEIEISGNLNPDRLFGKSFTERAGFKKIQVTLKPYADTTPELLKSWVQTVENRCPINDNLGSITPIEIEVLNNFTKKTNIYTT